MIAASSDLLVVDLAGDLLGFLEDAVDGRAVDLLGLLAVQLEDLLEAVTWLLVSSRCSRRPA